MEYSPSLGIQVLEAGMKYKGRGDPAGLDFGDVDLIIDGAWHSLDLSGIVPEAGANNLVHFFVRGRTTNPGAPAIRFAKIGDTHFLNIAGLFPPVANQTDWNSDIWVMMDASRVIQYIVMPGSTEFGILVRGWLEG